MLPLIQRVKADMMQLFLLGLQLSLASGLRVIDNGLGLQRIGAEENMVDYTFFRLTTTIFFYFSTG